MPVQETDEPYAGLRPDQLILRDRLAADRTVLANERTLLAYVRTGLTLLVAGASLLQFFESRAAQALGWALLPLSAIAFVVGVVRFRKMSRSLREVTTSEERSVRERIARP